MKTKRILKFSFLLSIAIFFSSLAEVGAMTNEAVSKNFSKTFTIGSNDLLFVSNSFGNITVTHWDKNEAEIKVVVEAKSSNEQRAREGLDRINIELNKSGNKISATTTMKGEFSGNNSNVSLNINYHISIPSQMAIDLNQKYGTINLPENNNGVSSITVKYGKVFAGNFSKHLDFDIAYSDARLKNLATAEMELAYSNVTLGDAKKLEIESKYSTIKATGKIGDFEIEDKYGTANLNEVRRVVAESKYGKINIEKLSKSFVADGFSYSNLTIKELASDFDRIIASAKYGTVEITVSPNAAFRIEAKNIKYGTVKLNGLNDTKSTVDRNFQRRKINGGGKGVISFDGGGYGTLIVKPK